jgi:histidinol-phosphatase (PHP family)
LDPFKDDFDYLYGSVHVVTDWTIDDDKFLHKWDEQSIDSIYGEYYQVLAKMARTRLFDVVGHFDLPKKFRKFPTDNLDARIGSTLDAIKVANMVIEINTAGLRKPVGEIYPSPHILNMVHDKGISITFGSDAHDPVDVAYAFDKALLLARSAGFSSLVTFKQRKPIVLQF